jgi:hypothetical protein
MSFDFERFKSFMFLPILVMLIMSVSFNYAVNDNLKFYQNQVYVSWEQQQDYSEMLRQEINSYKDKVSDLNTQLEVCKTELKYVNFIYSEVV